ncbi:transmembrane protein 128 [Brienomyrus brachyistius]|uniref:transmembrane protein 128 n=1 Tax=Brienomyrus brachyistius TaxID=42636 RepID=UPI0020B34423|nr:transmembrane protein 128 [Brienomyrus brachyistius]
MAGALADSELQSLRNRFKKDAEFVLRGVSENDTGEKSSEDKDAKPLPRFNRHSIFWIVASIGLTYYTDFVSVLMKDENIKSWWFNVGVALLGVSLAMALFSIVYLDWFRGVRQYDVQYPAIAPVTTATFIAASCSFNIALWPVWSICTPIILFTQFMGIVMFISLLG